MNDHDILHDYIEQYDDHARGYYAGFIKALFHIKHPHIKIDLDYAGYDYSPSGNHRGSEHFYEEPHPTSQDNIHHTFDPCLFHAIARELDSEGGIWDWRIKLIKDTTGTPMIEIEMRTSEDEDDLIPDDFQSTWDELLALRYEILNVYNKKA